MNFTSPNQKKVIKKHRVEDLEAILDVWYQASTLAHPFLDSAFVAKVKKDMREMYIPDSETWVYQDEGKVVGFISMMGHEIAGLFVLPKSHSKGIGTALVDYVADKHSELEVDVFKKNKIGRAFYNKYGFETFREEFNKESNQLVLRMKISKTKKLNFTA